MKRYDNHIQLNLKIFIAFQVLLDVSLNVLKQLTLQLSC